MTQDIMQIISPSTREV